MTSENLKTVIERHQPFTILMADGKEYDVPHTDFISFTQKRTAVVLTTEDDHIVILPLILMSAIKQKIGV